MVRGGGKVGKCFHGSFVGSGYHRGQHRHASEAAKQISAEETICDEPAADKRNTYIERG